MICVLSPAFRLIVFFSLPAFSLRFSFRSSPFSGSDYVFHLSGSSISGCDLFGSVRSFSFSGSFFVRFLSFCVLHFRFAFRVCSLLRFGSFRFVARFPPHWFFLRSPRFSLFLDSVLQFSSRLIFRSSLWLSFVRSSALTVPHLVGFSLVFLRFRFRSFFVVGHVFGFPRYRSTRSPLCVVSVLHQSRISVSRFVPLVVFTVFHHLISRFLSCVLGFLSCSFIVVTFVFRFDHPLFSIVLRSSIYCITRFSPFSLIVCSLFRFSIVTPLVFSRLFLFRYHPPTICFVFSSRFLSFLVSISSFYSFHTYSRSFLIIRFYSFVCVLVRRSSLDRSVSFVSRCTFPAFYCCGSFHCVSCTRLRFSFSHVFSSFISASLFFSFRFLRFVGSCVLLSRLFSVTAPHLVFYVSSVVSSPSDLFPFRFHLRFTLPFLVFSLSLRFVSAFSYLRFLSIFVFGFPAFYSDIVRRIRIGSLVLHSPLFVFVFLILFFFRLVSFVRLLFRSALPASLLWNRSPFLVRLGLFSFSSASRVSFSRWIVLFCFAFVPRFSRFLFLRFFLHSDTFYSFARCHSLVSFLGFCFVFSPCTLPPLTLLVSYSLHVTDAGCIFVFDPFVLFFLSHACTDPLLCGLIFRFHRIFAFFLCTSFVRLSADRSRISTY